MAGTSILFSHYLSICPLHFGPCMCYLISTAYRPFLLSGKHEAPGWFRFWLESLWRRNSPYDCTVLLCTEPFSVTLSSFQYDLNNVERDVKHQIVIIIINIKKTTTYVNPSLAEHDMPCLRKQCRSRSVGFLKRSHLVWICTVCH